jgi:hypothetical protein
MQSGHVNEYTGGCTPESPCAVTEPQPTARLPGGFNCRNYQLLHTVIAQLNGTVVAEESVSILASIICGCKRPLWALPLAALVAMSAKSPAQLPSSNAQKIQNLQTQLDEMKALMEKQMENLQAQIRDLSQAEQVASATALPSIGTANLAPVQQPSPAAAQTPQPAPSQRIGEATATYQTESQDQLAAARIDNTPLDPRFPGYFRLMGTETLLRIGGYFNTDFIYDLKPAGDPEQFIPATFPIPSSPGVNNTTISIRPTRMNLDFLVPVKSSSVRFFIEFDLFGTNSTTPRLRHAYAQADNFLLGQSFSNFSDPDSWPDTLDFEGPTSLIGIRNPQFRYTIAGLGTDAAPANAADPRLKAVPLTATFGAYQHYWMKRLRSSAVFGYDQTQNTDLQPPTSYHQSDYSAANIIWNPIGSLDVGTEFLYGWLVQKDKASANAPRFMLSAKYNFVKMPAAK